MINAAAIEAYPLCWPTGRPRRLLPHPLACRSSARRSRGRNRINDGRRGQIDDLRLQIAAYCDLSEVKS